MVMSMLQLHPTHATDKIYTRHIAITWFFFIVLPSRTFCVKDCPRVTVASHSGDNGSDSLTIWLLDSLTSESLTV